MLQSFTLNYTIHNDNTHILKYRVNQKLIQRQLVSSMGTFLRRCTDGQSRECQCALARGQYQLPRCYWQSRGVIVCWQGGQCRVLVTLLFLLCYWQSRRCPCARWPVSSFVLIIPILQITPNTLPTTSPHHGFPIIILLCLCITNENDAVIVIVIESPPLSLPPPWSRSEALLSPLSEF